MLTHRQRLQLAPAKPKNKKSLARTLLRRKRIQLSQFVPPIRDQRPPYHRSEFRLGVPGVHCLGAVDGVLLDYGIDSRRTWGQTTNLARVVVKTSGILNAGYGLFAGQDIAKDQLFTEYYGTIRSETEAAELKLKVPSFNFFVVVSVLVTSLETKLDLLSFRTRAMISISSGFTLSAMTASPL